MYVEEGEESCSDLTNFEWHRMKVRELLENFEADARLLLLFLRNLERISVYERDRTSKTCRLVYRVQLADSCVADVRRARTDFVEKLRDGEWQDRTVTASYPVTITTESFREVRTANSSSSSSQKRHYSFLVTNYCCGGQVCRPCSVVLSLSSVFCCRAGSGYPNGCPVLGNSQGGFPLPSSRFVITYCDQSFWPTVLSVEPLVQCLVCLSSVCRLSVTFCIVVKRCVLVKKCLKE